VKAGKRTARNSERPESPSGFKQEKKPLWARGGGKKGRENYLGREKGLSLCPLPQKKGKENKANPSSREKEEEVWFEIGMVTIGRCPFVVGINAEKKGKKGNSPTDQNKGEKRGLQKHNFQLFAFHSALLQRRRKREAVISSRGGGGKRRNPKLYSIDRFVVGRQRKEERLSIKEKRRKRSGSAIRNPPREERKKEFVCHQKGREKAL